MQFPAVPSPWRPAVTGLLIAGVIMMAALNAAILEAHGKLSWSTPGWLARGIWTYGPIGVFYDPPIKPIRLTDPSNYHRSCGPDCQYWRTR